MNDSGNPLARIVEMTDERTQLGSCIKSTTMLFWIRKLSYRSTDSITKMVVVSHEQAPAEIVGDCTSWEDSKLILVNSHVLNESHIPYCLPHALDDPLDLLGGGIIIGLITAMTMEGLHN
ncbi:hypothetical protein RRG08_062198 [Elysia crispata]|uniref:Uncharacterized protein n=1 Tax=Elysia crispata TaxID=231223 RepID=A0AAE1CV86_9GAST|nr:hypothetical protein RRG08_062198 [Elysia crispata]